jgi:(E)-4-hydroxy-3-methylbut-2-enyl-diphosphate synthase
MGRISKAVRVGSLVLGGNWPVRIQTMWKDPLPSISDAHDPALSSLVERIKALSDIGCEILRFSVPDESSARTLGLLAQRTSIPLVADSHYDWKIALLCMDYPIAKIRINPGNIGARWKTAEVVAKAREKSVALRIGVNAGSLPADLKDREDLAEACLVAAEREVSEFEALGFENFLVSMKLNNPVDVEKANRLFASRHDYPLHLGVTEAGPIISGVARNTAALVPLLKDGIGATIRVSLSDSMESELIAAREILGCTGIDLKGVRIVSCPRCGRASFDPLEFLSRWSDRLYTIQVPLEIAVMGCVVNGPGEARHADLGITGAGDDVLIFKKGLVVQKIKKQKVDEAFKEVLQEVLDEASIKLAKVE